MGNGMMQWGDAVGCNIIIMQQKLIVTLWKAQFRDLPRESSVYTRFTYNGTERSSKPTSQSKNYAWKETFIFPLAKKLAPLRLDFIALQEDHEVHFARDNVAEAMSFGHALVDIDVEHVQHGSLPCKVDIMSVREEAVGKIFIEYEIIKTEVAYAVEKQMDYFYLLKMTNFRVSFVRHLKRTPKFYLNFIIDGKEHKQDLPFEQDEAGFAYNYPVKLYLKREIDMEVQLFVREDDYSVEVNEYQTESSFNKSITSQDKTHKSSSGKKEKIMLQLGKEKIAGHMDLSFKRDAKLTKKIPLTTLVKFQKREIGVLEFQAEVIFKSKEELQYLEEQKKGLSPQKESKSLERKKSVVKQSNGIIIVNSILGRLELFNDALIENRNMSLELKLGKQSQQSTTLQCPGKELIVIDTFSFKRTWEETMKITLQVHNGKEKLPCFFADVNLRELFQLGRYASKKVKLRDENKNYSGELTLDMVYKQQEEKKSPIVSSVRESLLESSELLMPQEEVEEGRLRSKRSLIEDRMRRREEERARSKEIYSMSTLAVLQENEIILPPLKSSSRMQTLSPKQLKHKPQIFNGNGNVKFNKSPRFESAERPGYESYTYVRESDFDSRRKKGAAIGYGNKYDFVKPVVHNPGVGRYEIASVWDKYK